MQKMPPVLVGTGDFHQYRVWTVTVLCSAWNDRSTTRSIRPDFELNYLRIAVSHLNL